MPRHQTSRQIGEPAQPSDKLDILRKYAALSNRVQEYGSAALSCLEAVLMIISAVFLYTNLIGHYGNWASFFLITSQCISLVPNAMDLYELLGFLKKNPDRFGEFTVLSHLIVVASYIIGTLLLICGCVFTLSYIGAYGAAPWIFLAGSCFFVLGAVFGASDSLIKADQFILFFGALFGKCMIAGTFSYLFGSVLGVINIWAGADKTSTAGYWIANIQAGTFQAGGVFFLLGSLLSFVIVLHKNTAREQGPDEKSYLIS